MSSGIVEKIANAVLYEGYILYPYRASAVKNQQRWNFGTLGPGEIMQTECLLRGSPDSVLDVKVRFLQMLAREGHVWNDAKEHAVLSSDLRLQDLTHKEKFGVDPEMEASVDIAAKMLRERLFQVTVRITNLVSSEDRDREAVLLRSLVSTHTILSVRGGEFVSLLDPPDEFRDEAKACRNIGTWPVLAGEEGTHDSMLSSPIILYDYPKIAPESPGDFYDGTEMDEMLALRVLTLTDDEKREMRGGDERARKILEQTETLPDDHMMKLHGVVRGMRQVEPFAEEKLAPASIRVFGIDVKKDDRVRLWPKKGGDIFDMALEGKIAIVEAIEQDFEDRVHLAVVLEDDPGRDLGAMRQPGHRFFFSPEEIEPLALESQL